MASGLGGLLPGIIGGAAEGAVVAANDIADAALRERAAARRDKAAERAANKREDRADARAKLKAGGTGKEEKPPKTIRTNQYDPDTGEEIEETREWNKKTKTYDKIVKGEDVDLYYPVMSALMAKGMSPNKAARAFKQQTGKALPPGVLRKVSEKYKTSNK